jgi:SAM-dependent methyltransferase
MFMSRAEREKKAYDENDVWGNNNKWHMAFKHVFESPNTIRSEKKFDDLIIKNIAGKKVLDMGCAEGGGSYKLFSLGAGYVHGIDISEKFISEAKKLEIKGRLEFSNKDATAPIEERFDIILGRAILHHIDYRAVLNRLYDLNLNRGGSIIFMEPLGSNLLIKLYHNIAKSAHTPDEKPFFRNDLKWLRENFRNIEVIPINYLSLPFGILSSFLFSGPDNYIMRLCDRVDCWLAGNIKFIVPNFRYCILVIRKN